MVDWFNTQKLRRIEAKLDDLLDKDPASTGRWSELMASVDDLRAAITDYIAKVDAALARLNDGIAAIQAQLDSDEATDAAAIQPLLDQVKAASDALPAAPPEATQLPS
jgi:ABC-type transporter Mla subunit MlaD